MQRFETWGNDWIAARETPDGLLFTASNKGRALLADAYRHDHYTNNYQQAEFEVIDNIGGNGLEFIAPEHLGLTEMPAFSTGLAFVDDGDARQWDGEGAPIYGYPAYQISDPWQELKNRGRVLFPIVERS